MGVGHRTGRGRSRITIPRGRLLRDQGIAIGTERLVSSKKSHDQLMGNGTAAPSDEFRLPP